jgi:hypothetical protein
VLGKVMRWCGREMPEGSLQPLLTDKATDLLDEQQQQQQQRQGVWGGSGARKISLSQLVQIYLLQHICRCQFHRARQSAVYIGRQRDQCVGTGLNGKPLVTLSVYCEMCHPG